MTLMKLSLLGLGLGALTLSASTSNAADILVPAQQPTIQAGIDAAAPGDVVLLGNGVYTGPGNRDLDLRGKAITVKSVSDDPTACVIDCQQLGRGFYFNSSETSASIVRGITITRGMAGSGGGVYVGIACKPLILNCILTNNSADFFGGGIFTDSSSSPLITNCILTNNSAAYNGGGVFVSSSSPIVTNCSLTRNSALAGGSGIYNGFFASPIVTNSIVWGNTGSEILGDMTSGPIVTYSDVLGGYVGAGNLNVDPLFVNALTGDLRLQAGSFAIDAGDTSASGLVGITTDLLGNARLQNARVDLGAFEFQSLSKITVTLKELERECGEVDVELVLKNTGSLTEDNIKITSVMLGGVSAKGRLPKNIGTLRPGKKAAAEFEFRGITRGTKVLTLSGTSNKGSFSFTQTVMVR
jgi:hypothetical protein